MSNQSEEPGRNNHDIWLFPASSWEVFPISLAHCRDFSNRSDSELEKLPYLNRLSDYISVRLTATSSWRDRLFCFYYLQPATLYSVAGPVDRLPSIPG